MRIRGLTTRQAGGGGSAAGSYPGTTGEEAADREADREAGRGAVRKTERRLTRRLRHADLRAVPEVRRALRDLLRNWGGPGRDASGRGGPGGDEKRDGKRDGKRNATGPAATAELLTSELVTNALLHTDHDALVTATLATDRLRVEVRDFDGGDPRPRVPDADTGTHGRGLLLVEALADVWGVREHAVGKSVWFELRAQGM